MEMSFDGKSSLGHYGLALDYCYITAAKRKQAPVDVLAADGTVDAMNGFEPTYGNRTVTAGFSIAAGSAEEVRGRLLKDLEGRTVEIVLPDNPNYYMSGSVHIAAAGCRAGSSVTITADCLPWRYSRLESVHKIPAAEADVQHIWYNSGKRKAVPEITVDDVPVIIGFHGTETTLAAGTYLMPDLAIPGGDAITVTTRGGAFTARYREAIL